MANDSNAANEIAPLRRVLNAGAGPRGSNSLPACFRTQQWREIRLDLNPEVQPDVVGTVTDMRAHFGDGTFDAVWSSHNIEHLYDHEVIIALAEFYRVLKPNGFAAITCPDLQSVAEMLLDRGLDGKAYNAPIGPIAVHDICLRARWLHRVGKPLHGASNRFHAGASGLEGHAGGLSTKFALAGEMNWTFGPFCPMPECRRIIP